VNNLLHTTILKEKEMGSSDPFDPVYSEPKERPTSDDNIKRIYECMESTREILSIGTKRRCFLQRPNIRLKAQEEENCRITDRYRMGRPNCCYHPSGFDRP
jgi:hypothetical protein